MQSDHSVLIIEDDISQSKYIEFILHENKYVCKIVHTVKNAIAILEHEKFFMAFLDLTLPDGYGYQIMEHINQNRFDIAIAVLSARKDPDSIIESFKLGAIEYLIKPVTENTLVTAINNAKEKREGKLPFLKKNLSFIANRKLLTPREYEILELITSGENYKNISQKLYISQNTFKVHLKNVFQKLQLNNRTEIVYQFNCSDIRDHF